MTKTALVCAFVLAVGSACSSSAPLPAAPTPSLAQTRSAQQQRQPSNLQHLKNWVGEYPIDKQSKPPKNFLNLPEIRKPLIDIIGDKYFERLQNNYYLTTPIELIDNHLVLDFPPNNHLNRESDRIIIVIGLSDGAMHVALQGKADMRWLPDRNVPPAILQKFALPDATKMDEPPDDTTPPEIKITTPAKNFVTQDSSITVSGTVADPNASASGVARITVNGKEATRDVMAGTWTISNVALMMGENTITVSAVDNYGNVATEKITVTRRNR